MVNNVMYWKLVDAYEMGYEYECSKCHKHIDARRKGIGLPEECPYCGAKRKETIE